MTMLRLAIALTLALVVPAPTGTTSTDGAALPQADPPAEATPATLADVAFMAGHWVGGEGGDVSEEVWTAPAGDSMLGMWRYVSGGKLRVAELLTLKAEGNGVVLRFRHFDPSFVAREDKATPVVLELVKRGTNEARFEGPAVGATGTVALTYRRPDPDTLEGTLERGGRVEKYAFKRQPAAK